MLQAAVDRLHSRELCITRVSTVYETEPQGLRDQRWFLNAVAEAQTDLFPRQLLGRIVKIERELGRRRGIEHGPRTIDIDILLFGNSVVKTGELTIPHPRFAERRFVLAPMAELAPELRDPVSHRTIRELLTGTAWQGVRQVEFRVVLRTGINAPAAARYE
jgi:2-amino-4-hydroxy-6-hydroxymethyldihydropteridine diphosphokinase